jgi:hypothetical protein
MPTFPPRGLVAEFCEQVVVHDLPDLPPDRRRTTVEFAVRRIAGLPSPMQLAVGAVALAAGGVGRVAGARRLVAMLARRPVPIAGEYVRLVRSLAYAFIWETWPDTSATGRPLDRAVPAAASA